MDPESARCSTPARHYTRKGSAFGKLAARERGTCVALGLGGAGGPPVTGSLPIGEEEELPLHCRGQASLQHLVLSALVSGRRLGTARQPAPELQASRSSAGEGRPDTG